MFSCSSQEIKNHNSTNTQIYINGAIYTVNESQTWAEAMIVEDGIIRYVGSTIEAQKHITSSTSIIKCDVGLSKAPARPLAFGL